MVGGLTPGIDEPVPGRVTARERGGSGVTTTVAVGRDGRFAMTLTDGIYEVTGYSPRFGDGKYPCTPGGPVTITTRPVNTTARAIAADDYPAGLTEDEANGIGGLIEDLWGTEAFVAAADPGLAGDTNHLRWMAKSQRAVWSRREAATYVRWGMWTDVRSALPSISAPTLVLHRKDAAIIPFAHGRYLAEHIPTASFAPLDGVDATFYRDADALDEIERFLKKIASPVEPDRALAVVLFTDIVDSTKTAVALGDGGWRNVLDSHDVIARTIVEQYRGRLVKLTGDGVLATFDGPGSDPMRVRDATSTAAPRPGNPRRRPRRRDRTARRGHRGRCRSHRATCAIVRPSG
jgi:pimeloyl-ACP methyl ester carboxylesterase